MKWPYDDRDLLTPKESLGLIAAMALGLVIWFVPGLVLGYLIWGQG